MEYIKYIFMKRIGKYFINWHPFAAFMAMWSLLMLFILYMSGQLG